MIKKIAAWWRSVAHVWVREVTLSFRDPGVIIFFLVVCAAYPVLYSLIYNPEVERDMPVVVIDNNRSHLSRELTRKLDATPEVAVVATAVDLNEAREMLNRKQCYGIVVIPQDFSSDIARGIQAHVVTYSDMSLMLRYKNLLMAITNVTQAMGAEMQSEALAAVAHVHGSIIESRQVPLSNTGMGIASAILLFVLPLVVQQSMILGIGMLHGGSIERRRRNGGRDPEAIDASVSATIIGKTLCHVVIYILPTVYALHFTPIFFDFPQNGDLFQIMLIALPFVIGVSLMGQVLQVLVNERESVFVLFAFSSVLFIFLSGASWPRYAMSPFWRAVGDCLPCMWMSNAYTAMQADGATLSQLGRSFAIMWIQVVVLYVLAYLVERFVSRVRYRAWQRRADSDPEALSRFDIVKNGVL